MYFEISFPGLGLRMDPSRYGLIIAAGFLLAVVYACRRAKQFGLKEDDILDILFVATPLAIVSARAYYCIFNWSLFADNPISVLYIWNGGLAIYGGVIGAVLAVIVCTRIKHIPARPLLDLAALGFMIGQCIGRWGNFVNREAFGAETDCFLRMGLTDATGHTIYVHPTFLYESVWNLIGFVLLHCLSKRRKYDGQIALGYVAWYGLGRGVIEGLRTDSLYLFSTGIRVSQLLAIVFFAVSVGVIVWVRVKRRPTPETLYVNRRKQAEASQPDAPESENM